MGAQKNRLNAVSLRRFFWVPTTYVLVEQIRKLNFCYTLLTKVLYIEWNLK